VQVEQLKNLSLSDALAHGCGSSLQGFSPEEEFRKRWEETHGIGSWDVNPWVWAVHLEIIGGK
jgi:hypothetical protein